MEYAEEARPRRPQMGVRYGLEGYEPSRRSATWRPASGLARYGAMDAVAPRSAATLWEPTASPWFYPRVVAALWLGIGFVMAFATTSIGYLLLVGHELRRSVAAAFVVGLFETAASLSLGLAFWSRLTRLVLVLSIAFGAFLVLTGLLEPPLGFIVALAAGVIVLMSLVMLRDQAASQAGIAVFAEDAYEDGSEDAAYPEPELVEDEAEGAAAST